MGRPFDYRDWVREASARGLTTFNEIAVYHDGVRRHWAQRQLAVQPVAAPAPWGHWEYEPVEMPA